MSWSLYNHNIIPSRATSYACDKFRTVVPPYVDNFWPAESSIFDGLNIGGTSHYIPATKGGVDLRHFNRTNDAGEEIIPYSSPVVPDGCYDSWRATHNGFGSSGAYIDLHTADFFPNYLSSGSFAFGFLGKQYIGTSNIDRGKILINTEQNGGGGTFSGWALSPHSRQYTGVDNFRVSDRISSNRTDKAWSAITGAYTDEHWYHINCRWSGTNQSIDGYVDGVLQASKSWINSGAITTRPRQLQIFGAPLTNAAANGEYNNFYFSTTELSVDAINAIKTAFEANYI